MIVLPGRSYPHPQIVITKLDTNPKQILNAWVAAAVTGTSPLLPKNQEKVGMAIFEDITFQVVREVSEELENILDADILYFNGEIRLNIFAWFRETLEKMAAREEKKAAIAIILTTPGGQAEAAEKLVEVVRNHYGLVYFIVPVTAMSAGTIFCMSGDKIYMDYSSSLGPIDPQVPDSGNKVLVPALGYLDKVKEFVEKSRNNTITPIEFKWLMGQDLAMLRFFEQARDLSIALLQKWLVQYKFKDWSHHRTNNKGAVVTAEEKQTRAREIAELLSNNAHWHSHGRMIGMATLRTTCHLEIDDFGQNPNLQKAVRRFSDTLSEYLAQGSVRPYLYNARI